MNAPRDASFDAYLIKTMAEQSAYDVWQAEQRFKTAPMRVQFAPAMAA